MIGGDLAHEELEVAERVVHDGGQGPVEAVADLGLRERREVVVASDRVVEDDPLRVEVAAAVLLRRPAVIAAGDEHAAVRERARVLAAVGHHGELRILGGGAGAEEVRRLDDDRLVDLRQHALERLVEVDAVLPRVERRVLVDGVAGRARLGLHVAGDQRRVVASGSGVSSSITLSGISRPPRPTIVGLIVPVPPGVTVARSISVSVRLA